MKIPWEQTFMEMAQLISKRSHCRHIKVGAVIAKITPGAETILSFGYNGPARTRPHCDEGECTNRSESGEKLDGGYCVGAHAEINAMLNAARNGISIEGATLFVTCSPCMECAKHILNSGLEGVIFLNYYSDSFPDKRQEDERAITLIRMGKVCHQFGRSGNL